MINEGIVIEATKKDAVVMTPEKAFVTIKNRYNLIEGDHVYFENKDIIKEKKPLHYIMPLCASAAVFIFALILFFALPDHSKEYAYIHMDMNSSVEISINDENEVVDINAINDADELLNGLKLKGETLSLAIKDLLERSVEISLVNKDENEVLFSACLNDESTSADNLDSIFAILDETVSKIKDIEINSYNVKADIETLKKSSSYSLSMGRLMVYEKLISSGKSISLEETKTMEVAELIEVLEDDKAKSGDTSKPQNESSSSLTALSTNKNNTPSPNRRVITSALPSTFAATPGTPLPNQSEISSIMPSSSMTTTSTPSPYLGVTPSASSTPIFSINFPLLHPTPTTLPSSFVFINTPSQHPTPTRTPSPSPSVINNTSPYESKTPTVEPRPSIIINNPPSTPVPTPTHIPTPTPTTKPSPTLAPATTPPPSLSNNTITPNNLLINGDFSQELSGWTIRGGSKSQLGVSVENSQFNVELYVPVASCDLMINSNEFTLINGKTYILEFDASTNINVKLKAVVSESEPTKLWHASQEFQLSQSMQKYSLKFNMKHATSQNNAVVFMLVKPDANLVLDNVKIYEYSGS